MKLVMTILARDEVDIVDAQLTFHLNAGVDFVIATDNRSQDGTTEIFESYARERYLHLIREESEGFQQSAWVTRMARLAATDFGADWVINSDADEFWWPRGGDLKEMLAAIPARFGTLQAPIRHFFLRPDDRLFFSERMIVRPTLNASINEPGNPLRPNTHVLHRADPAAAVTTGSHAIHGSSLAPLAGWHPIEVLHFPLRSLEQARRRHSLPARASTNRAAFEAHERGELEQFIQKIVLGDDVLERGLSDGSLVIDTRLRDALRTLAGVEPVPKSAGDGNGRRFALPEGGARRLVFPRSSAAEDATYAVEAAVLGEADVVRVQRRMDELERRLASLERTFSSRLRARVAWISRSAAGTVSSRAR